MSSSKPLRKLVIVATLALGSAALGACSFTPVYSDAARASQAAFELSYAKPNNRMEQVIYQELALRFGRSTSPTAARASVTVSAPAGDTMLSQTADPAKQVEVSVNAVLTITPAAGSTEPPLRIERRAVASYTRNDNVLADQEAAIEARDRAAKAAAESLRLAIFAERARR